MNEDLKITIRSMSLIALITGIMFLISPLILLFSNWLASADPIANADPNIIGIGLMIIGIMGMCFLSRNKED